MIPLPGQSSNDPQFKEALRRWKQDNSLRSPLGGNIPAEVQTAWNSFNNPPAGTGGLKPTKQMAAQFSQYGLTGNGVGIGKVLPDGTIKGDSNNDGRFGLRDFILPKVKAPKPAPATPSFDDQVRDARADMYGTKKRRNKRPRIDADSLADALRNQQL